MFINVICIYLRIPVSNTIFMFTGFNRNTMGVICGGRTATLSGAPEFTLGRS